MTWKPPTDAEMDSMDAVGTPSPPATKTERVLAKAADKHPGDLRAVEQASWPALAHHIRHGIPMSRTAASGDRVLLRLAAMLARSLDHEPARDLGRLLASAVDGLDLESAHRLCRRAIMRRDQQRGSRVGPRRHITTALKVIAAALDEHEPDREMREQVMSYLRRHLRDRVR